MPRKFGPGFKLEAIRRAYDSSGSISQVARDMGISQPLLTQWMQKAHAMGTDYCFYGDYTKRQLMEMVRQRDEEIEHLKHRIEVMRLGRRREGEL